MQSKLSPKDFVYYELAENSGYSFHFFNYRTPDGKMQGVKELDMPDGSIKYKSFVIERNQKYPVHRANTEYIKFLDNHPNNPSSPFFSGVVKFKRYEPEVVDRNAINDKSKRAEAVIEAVNLKGQRLYEVASLLGFFFTEEEESRAIRAIVEFAETKPTEFIRVLQTPHKEAKLRRVVKAGIHGGIIRKENDIYRFGDVTLGADEDAVVARLSNDADLTSLIDRRLDLYKDDIPAAPSEQKPTQKAPPAKAAK